MKLFKLILLATATCMAMTLLGGCSEDGTDNRELDYGHVQFKLYKEVSYEKTTLAGRAVQTQLDYLSDATKVTVRLDYNGTMLAQTLTLDAADKDAAEYGLRSTKLKLLTGNYRVVAFSLYDKHDELLYNGLPQQNELTVAAGGLTTHDLTVNVMPRGKVRVTLLKDMSDFVRTRAGNVNRQYTFDEIKHTDLTVQNTETNDLTTFEKLPMEFAIHFDEQNEANGTFGYQTSSSKCDSLLSLPAGEYRIVSYVTYDKNKTALETNDRPAAANFTVEDNETTEIKAKIALYESDEYIKDYYALKAIWEALDGPRWSYAGESYNPGANWDFNKDPDLWGAQPGVQLHDNGRVARLDLSGFGFRGDMPAAIGQLTEMIELYLGTQNDKNYYDPTEDLATSMANRARNRKANHKAYYEKHHPATQMSWPCALALREHDIHTPSTALYDEGYTENQIFDTQGNQLNIRPAANLHGKICNGLKSLPKEIGNLKKLEILNIANSEIKELPAEMVQLESCTDLELYNCPKMEQFPQVLAEMPKLVSLNISENKQWSEHDPDGLAAGLEAIGNGKSQSVLQLFYCRNNNVTAIPDSFRNLKKLGALDMCENKISKLPAGGLGEVAPTEIRLDHNLIEEFPTTNGKFCPMEDMETFSATYNKLKVFPNIFSSKGKYVIKTVDFSYNEIEKLPDDFNGILVNTLTLANNKIKVFPKELLSGTNSYVSYIILRGNGMTEIPEGSFKGEFAASLASLDLTYNRLKELPKDFTAEDLPYLYGVALSYNAFASFPYKPLNSSGLTVFAVRGQRDDNGARCLREWPTGIYKHTGLRGLFLGSNDLRKVDDKISYLIYNLDISDNPNIVFDASDICIYWRNGAYMLVYDKTQKIINCDEMLQ